MNFMKRREKKRDKKQKWWAEADINRHTSQLLREHLRELKNEKTTASPLSSRMQHSTHTSVSHMLYAGQSLSTRIRLFSQQKEYELNTLECDFDVQHRRMQEMVVFVGSFIRCWIISSLFAAHICARWNIIYYTFRNRVFFFQFVIHLWWCARIANLCNDDDFLFGFQNAYTINIDTICRSLAFAFRHAKATDKYGCGIGQWLNARVSVWRVWFDDVVLRA